MEKKKRKRNRRPLEATYDNMRKRCNNPDPKDASLYKEKGITVCDRWKGNGGYARFVEDMGPKPTPAHTLDRRDGTKGYSPENCRWATPREQCENQSNNRINIRVQEYVGGVRARIVINGKEHSKRFNTKAHGIDLLALANEFILNKRTTFGV